MTHSGFSGHRAYQQQSRADVRSEASTVTTEMVGPAACADITDEIARGPAGPVRLTRRAMMLGSTTHSLPAGSIPGRWYSARLALVAGALIAVGAVGADVADQIQADVGLAWSRCGCRSGPGHPAAQLAVTTTPGTGSGSPAPRARPIGQRHEGLGRATDGSRGWGAQLLGTDRALAVVSARCPGPTVRPCQAALISCRLSHWCWPQGVFCGHVGRWAL
jgi:hypothetical protein